MVDVLAVRPHVNQRGYKVIKMAKTKMVLKMAKDKTADGKWTGQDLEKDIYDIAEFWLNRYDDEYANMVFKNKNILRPQYFAKQILNTMTQNGNSLVKIYDELWGEYINNLMVQYNIDVTQDNYYENVVKIQEADVENMVAEEDGKMAVMYCERWLSGKSVSIKIMLFYQYVKNIIEQMIESQVVQ